MVKGAVLVLVLVLVLTLMEVRTDTQIERERQAHKPCCRSKRCILPLVWYSMMSDCRAMKTYEEWMQSRVHTVWFRSGRRSGEVRTKKMRNEKRTRRRNATNTTHHTPHTSPLSAINPSPPVQPCSLDIAHLPLPTTHLRLHTAQTLIRSLLIDSLLRKHTHRQERSETIICLPLGIINSILSTSAYLINRKEQQA